MEELQSGCKYWVSESGLVMDVEDPPRSLQHLDLGFRDNFGNTVLHLLAARGAEFSVVMEAIEYVGDANASNTAVQKFLHNFYGDLFGALAEGRADISLAMRRLEHFNARCHDCDAFRVTFLPLLSGAGMVNFRY
jgi:hypothetical protein